MSPGEDVFEVVDNKEDITGDGSEEVSIIVFTLRIVPVEISDCDVRIRDDALMGNEGEGEGGREGEGAGEDVEREREGEEATEMRTDEVKLVGPGEDVLEVADDVKEIREAVLIESEGDGVMVV